MNLDYLQNISRVWYVIIWPWASQFYAKFVLCNPHLTTPFFFLIFIHCAVLWSKTETYLALHIGPWWNIASTIVSHYYEFWCDILFINMKVLANNNIVCYLISLSHQNCNNEGPLYWCQIHRTNTEYQGFGLLNLYLLHLQNILLRRVHCYFFRGDDRRLKYKYIWINMMIYTTQSILDKVELIGLPFEITFDKTNYCKNAVWKLTIKTTYIMYFVILILFMLCMY